MKCVSCGADLPEGARACATCGAPVLPSTSVSQRSLKALREETTVHALREGDVLSGRYRLEEKIGEGGMGAVFTAHDQELVRRVAVKLLAASFVNDPDVQERFEREARLTAKLDHPHIIPIYDVGRYQGRPFIVMKLLEGQSLADRLRARGGFTTEETLKLMRQLAGGLDYIHAKGFIHRDIKSGNIFVSSEMHATILDFGILRAKEATTGITRTGMVMGTPHYMAPEQALGLRDVDHRLDLYALAVVLFECLTGTLPFEADSELRVVQLQAHAPPPDLVERAPWIPRGVADVVKRALAKKPEERFNSAAEMVDALDAAWAVAKSSKSSLPAVQTVPEPRRSRSNLPVVNAALSTSELAESVRPRRTSRALVVLLVLTVLGAGGWFVMQMMDKSAVVPPAPVPPTPVVIAVVDAGEEEELDDAGTEEIVEDLADAGETVVEVEVEDAGVAVENPLVKKNAVTPRKNQKGRLNVITMRGGEPYWAQVSIDGEPRGRTPLLLELPAGKYTLRIERTGFKKVTRAVVVPAGKVALVKQELRP